jgi:hypothetical protein
VRLLGPAPPEPPPPPAAPAPAGGAAPRRAWRVETVGAQLRDRADLHRRICAACGRTPGGEPLSRATAALADPERGARGGGGRGESEGDEGGSGNGAVPPADALLLVSGSHPARQVPGMSRCAGPGQAGEVHLAGTATRPPPQGAVSAP